MTTAIDYGTWLFTRGGESVLITRIVDTQGQCELHVRGPGREIATVEFADLMRCIMHQTGVEQRLVSQGFQFERFTTDRRRVAERRRVTRGDRRRRD